MTAIKLWIDWDNEGELTKGQPGSQGNAAVTISPKPKIPRSIEPMAGHLPASILVNRPKENTMMREPLMTKLAFIMLEF
jgi:hypothetical protein